MLKEFKEFISRGSVIDLAVGIIVGAAFTSIVNSLVNDIIMPPIGLLLGGIDFSNSVPSYFPLLMNGSQYFSTNSGSKYCPCPPAWKRSLTSTAPKPCVPDAPYPQLADCARTG